MKHKVECQIHCWMEVEVPDEDEPLDDDYPDLMPGLLEQAIIRKVEAISDGEVTVDMVEEV